MSTIVLNLKSLDRIIVQTLHFLCCDTFSSNHEMIIPILTELSVHMVVNYIYGTETPFPCQNYQHVPGNSNIPQIDVYTILTRVPNVVYFS